MNLTIYDRPGHYQMLTDECEHYLDGDLKKCICFEISSIGPKKDYEGDFYIESEEFYFMMDIDHARHLKAFLDVIISEYDKKKITCPS